MKKISFAVAAALAMCAAGSASAADGTITFTGRIVESTCSVDIGGGGGTTTVALRDVNPSALASNPAVGEVKFAIKLTGGTGTPATCTKDTANLIIDPVNSNLTGDGMIANTATAGTNVAVKLLNEDNGGAVIDLNNPGDSLVRAKSSGEFTYNLAARYHVPASESAAKAGNFSGKLVFDVENY